MSVCPCQAADRLRGEQQRAAVEGPRVRAGVAAHGAVAEHAHVAVQLPHEPGGHAREDCLGRRHLPQGDVTIESIHQESFSSMRK